MSTEPAYAFLDEIWRDASKYSDTTEPACSGAKGNLDDIMDIYIKDGQCKRDPIIRMGVVEEESMTPKRRVKANRDANVEGYNVMPSSFLKHAYEYSSFYDEGVEMAKREVVAQEEKEAVTICKNVQTDQNNARMTEITRDEIYRDIVEKFAASNKSHQNIPYLELAVYLLSGIFLIFMMEQILNIGKHMR
jgi:hypothetical protein